MSKLNLSGISESAIEKELNELINQMRENKIIQDTFPASIRTILVKLLSGFFSKVLYKVTLQQRETYSATASTEEAIYNLAITKGYNITRPTSPIISVKYTGEKTLSLSSAQVIGTYSNYDIIYWGPAKKIEAGDIIRCRLGKLIQYSSMIPDQEDVDYQYVKFDENGLFIVSLTPDKLQAIDDSCISLSFLDSEGKIKEIEVKKDIQDFLLKAQPLDFSSSMTSTNLTIAEKTYQYGLYYLKDNTPFEIKLIETDGMLGELKESSVSLDPDFRYYSFDSAGSDGDSLVKIKTLAPLAASALNRASSVNDIKYITKNSPYIQECYVTRDEGVKGIYQFDFTGFEFQEGQSYWISLNTGETVTKTIERGETLETIVNDFSTLLNQKSSFAMTTVKDKYKLIIQELTADNPLNITASQNITSKDVFSVLAASVQPGCCTVLIYYIHQNIARDWFIDDKTQKAKTPNIADLQLSKAEQEYYTHLFDARLDLSANTVLIPAKYKLHTLRYEVTYMDNTTQDEIDNLKSQILSNVVTKYDLKLANRVLVSEITADIAQLVVNGKNIIQSIKLVEGDNIELTMDTYYILNIILK
ncbi:TPA: hypothetical protein SFZ51_001343 [Campylobacter jejuni]|nr:hypothetical protein [Campylobacter jejuni]HEG8104640.1 hypothetical protein [Campylobacter jejuni]HEG8134417.1 hypothetical protein [Campylobacter jejuni]